MLEIEEELKSVLRKVKKESGKVSLKLNKKKKKNCKKPIMGFPGGSDHKKSACNAGDLGLIPGSG